MFMNKSFIVIKCIGGAVDHAFILLGFYKSYGSGIDNKSDISLSSPLPVSVS